MSRQESDREDLLREATALVQRVELEIPDFDESIVCGFRRNGCASIYWGPDAVYQFDSQNRLRRGYWDGQMIKAEHGRLVSLKRHRTAGQVILLRHELDNSEQANFLDELRQHVDQLKLAIGTGSMKALGQVPSDGPVVERVKSWLDALPLTIPIANTPRVG